MTPVLRVEGLSVTLLTRRGPAYAVRDVSLTVPASGTVTLIGESGSGKSTLVNAVLGLLSPRFAYIEADALEVADTDLPKSGRHGSSKDWRRIRRRELGIVPQDPQSALSPVSSVSSQFGGVLSRLGIARSERRDRMRELLLKVRIRETDRVLGSYPHQLSGGMLQRVLVAMAVAGSPRLLVADEPTSALDVTVQAAILDLILELQQETGMALLLVTHDLGVARQMSDQLCVMYAGRVVETGPAIEVLERPAMPYTARLLEATPRLGANRPMIPLGGIAPSALAPVRGCAFETRCDLSIDECSSMEPPLREVGKQHRAACHLEIDVTPDPSSGRRAVRHD